MYLIQLIVENGIKFMSFEQYAPLIVQNGIKCNYTASPQMA
jgi:hypothetical protein